ncbi:hypothetical protein [Streptomyces sp. NPDC002619]|uniref:hypothetical protein n=1 Tax=Streptomyces sp. NPDC002619 TaxID=3364655 RepID=UPI00367CDBD7
MVFTTTPGQPWWSLPVRPGERAYEFDPDTGGPAAGSGRPYPHPVLPREIAALEEERCGPYRDAFGLCTGCGLRGRVERRCTADDPDPLPRVPARPARPALEVGALPARLRLRRHAGDPPQHPVRTDPADQPLRHAGRPGTERLCRRSWGVRRRHQGRPDKATAPVCAHLIYGIVLGVKLTARCPES